MFKSKGTKIEWPEVGEGQTANMIISHKSLILSRAYASAMQAQKGKIYSKLCNLVYKDRHNWKGVIKTQVSHKARKGHTNHFENKSILTHRGTLMDAQGEAEKVQREDLNTSGEKFEGRSIVWYCND